MLKVRPAISPEERVVVRVGMILSSFVGLVRLETFNQGCLDPVLEGRNPAGISVLPRVSLVKKKKKKVLPGRTENLAGLQTPRTGSEHTPCPGPGGHPDYS